MIPQNAIREWRKFAPWADMAHVEQDLIITRALIELYNDPYLSKEFAFRGGTAMQKLFLDEPSRYSEDIDLVQLRGGPIGPAFDAIRKHLDSWLGEPSRSRKEGRFTLIYRYQSETSPTQPMRLKVEVNDDIAPLLRPDSPAFDWAAAEKAVTANLIVRLPGDPWRGDAETKPK